MPYNYATQTVNEILTDLQARIAAVEGGTAPVYPGEITDLTATAFSDTQIELAWTPAANATSHEYRRDGGAWLAAGNGSHTIIGLSAETSYDFEVRGVNADGAGNPSNTAGATTQAVPTTLTEPTLSRPTGGGDVDLARTNVVNGTEQDPTINLFGHIENNTTFNKWEMLWASVDLHETGRRPTFTLDFADWRQTTPPANNSLYWRPAGGHRDSWLPFDNRSVAGGVLTVSNNTAFAVAAIEVALAPMIGYSDIEDVLAEADATGFAFPMQASVALAAGATAPEKYAYHTFADQLSPNGIQVGGTHAYALGITDDNELADDGLPKRDVYHTWVHAGEQTGLRAMVKHIEFCLSDDPDAVLLRRNFRQFYFFANTAGLVGGMARGGAEPGDVGQDLNRAFWDNPTSSNVSDPVPVVESTIQALITEFGHDPDGRIAVEGEHAWHSHTFSSNLVEDANGGAEPNGFPSPSSPRAFRTILRSTYGGTIGDYGDVLGTVGASARFAKLATRYNLANTLEFSYASNALHTDLAPVSEAHARAMQRHYEAGWLTPGAAEPITISTPVAALLYEATEPGVTSITTASQAMGGPSGRAPDIILAYEQGSPLRSIPTVTVNSVACTLVHQATSESTTATDENQAVYRVPDSVPAGTYSADVTYTGSTAHDFQVFYIEKLASSSTAVITEEWVRTATAPASETTGSNASTAFSADGGSGSHLLWVWSFSFSEASVANASFGNNVLDVFDATASAMAGTKTYVWSNDVAPFILDLEMFNRGGVNILIALRLTAQEPV